MAVKSPEELGQLPAWLAVFNAADSGPGPRRL